MKPVVGGVVSVLTGVLALVALLVVAVAVLVHRHGLPSPEGVKTVHSAVRLADRHGLAMPITRTIHRVVTGDITAERAYDGLQRSHPAGHESEPG